MVAGGIGRNKRAVVAAGDDALTVRRARENPAAVDGDAARLLVARGKQQRLLAQHEHRRAPKKMHADHRRPGVDGANAVGERGKRGGGVGHAHNCSSNRTSPLPLRERVASAER